MKLNENRTLYIYVLIYFGFLYIPVMFLPIFSFNQGIHMAFPLQGFSTEHYEDMWNSPKLFDALWNSIYVGVVSSLMATMLAFFAAKAFTKYKFRGQALSYGAILTPFLIPEIILAIARIISGIKKGVRIAPYDKAWPRNLYFVNAFAAKKASIVAIKLETTPT